MVKRSDGLILEPDTIDSEIDVVGIIFDTRLSSLVIAKLTAKESRLDHVSIPLDIRVGASVSVKVCESGSTAEVRLGCIPLVEPSKVAELLNVSLFLEEMLITSVVLPELHGEVDKTAPVFVSLSKVIDFVDDSIPAFVLCDLVGVWVKEILREIPSQGSLWSKGETDFDS